MKLKSSRKWLIEVKIIGKVRKSDDRSLAGRINDRKKSVSYTVLIEKYWSIEI